MSAGLPPKAKSKIKSNTSAVAKVQRLTLFGPPQLLEGEDAAAYDELLGRVCAAVMPVDVVDEMFITDVVSLEWEVLRWRRLKTNLIRSLELKVLKRFVTEQLDYDHYQKYFEEDLTEILQDNLTEGQTGDDARRLAHQCATNERDADDKVNQILDDTDWDMDGVLNSAKTRKAEELAQEYMQHKPAAAQLVDKLFAEANLSIDALMVRELTDKLTSELDDIERIDHLTTIAETRRNVMLREIDRRHAALGEALRRHAQEVEGEFEVVEKTSAATKSAA
jgi:hypothetical protein